MFCKEMGNNEDGRTRTRRRRRKGWCVIKDQYRVFGGCGMSVCASTVGIDVPGFVEIVLIINATNKSLPLQKWDTCTGLLGGYDLRGLG